MKLSTRILIFLEGIALHWITATAGLIVGVSLGLGQNLAKLHWRVLPGASVYRLILGGVLGLLFSAIAASTAPERKRARWAMIGGSCIIVLLVALLCGYTLGEGANC